MNLGTDACLVMAWHTLLPWMGMLLLFLSLSTYQSVRSRAGNQEQSLQVWQPRGFSPRKHGRKNPAGSFNKEKQGKDEGRRGKKGKNRDHMGFKTVCLILCGLIHNCCMPGAGSSTSGSHQQGSGSSGQGKHMLNFMVSKRGGGRTRTIIYWNLKITPT